METIRQSSPVASRNVNPNQLLYTLMLPAIVLPLVSWMFSLALPVIRDDFGITADWAAWVATSFSLPFVILMPVYGRISDVLGKRRLLLLGIATFMLGSVLAIRSANLTSLMIGRIIQGFGVAGLLPLSLALITEVFPSTRLGWAMGMWSTVGPVTGVIGPILAGFIVAKWGWRVSFFPAILVALICLVVIYWMIPPSGQRFQFAFLTHFDWMGVVLLSAALTFLLFYFSSRPITGRPPLQDWRLLLLTMIFFVAFAAYEKRKANPFINLRLFKNRSLVVGSISAGLRMLALGGGLGFIMPLYLADVIQLNPTQSGFYLMVNPAAMAIVVRYGGNLSDRFGSRVIAMTGFGLITVVMFIFSLLPSHVSHGLIIFLLAVFGSGTGLMLAALHRASLNDVPVDELGTSSGLYSMIRFLGSVCGAAFGGIILQFYLDQRGPLIAYQYVFKWFAGFAILGFLVATFLPKNSGIVTQVRQELQSPSIQ